MRVLKIIGRLITLVIFISLIIYLAGLYGLPWLGRSVLAYYGFQQAHIASADIGAKALTFHDIYLAGTDNGASSIETLRIEFDYTHPYLRTLSVAGVKIHASWKHSDKLHIAGRQIPGNSHAQKTALTAKDMLQSLKLLKLPALPFENVTMKAVKLHLHMPGTTLTIDAHGRINAKGIFTAKIQTADKPLSLDMHMMGNINRATGQLAKLNAKIDNIALKHDAADIDDGHVTLTYARDAQTGKHIALNAQARKFVINKTAIHGLNLNANDTAQGTEINAKINRIEHANAKLDNLTTQLVLSRIYPLATYKTAGFTINKATLGVPFADINGSYRIQDSIPEFVELKARFADGRITLTPDEHSDSYFLSADKLNLSKLAQYSQVSGLSMKGAVGGKLPMRYDADKGIIIDKGRVSGGEDGFIHYEPDSYPSALRGDSMSMATTRKALRRLELNSLALKLNGPVRGDLDAELAIKGRNPDFSDRPVHLNLNLSGAIMSAVQQGLNIRFGMPRLKDIKQKMEQ